MKVARNAQWNILLKRFPADKGSLFSLVFSPVRAKKWIGLGNSESLGISKSSDSLTCLIIGTFQKRKAEQIIFIQEVRDQFCVLQQFHFSSAQLSFWSRRQSKFQIVTMRIQSGIDNGHT